MAKIAKVVVAGGAPTKKKTKKKVAKKKRATKKVAKKKVAKKTGKRRGRPPGSKNVKKKKRGRPAGKVGRPAGKRGRPAKRGPKKAMKSIGLPVDNDNLAYWSEMVIFLNDNKGKSFIVQMDGTNYTLCAV